MILQVRTLLYRMSMLGVTRANLAAITGLRENQISPMLLGRIPLDNDSHNIMYKTLERLEQLSDSIKPLSLDWNQTKLVKFLLQQLGDGEIRDLSHRLNELSQEFEHARI